MQKRRRTIRIIVTGVAVLAALAAASVSYVAYRQSTNPVRSLFAARPGQPVVTFLDAKAIEKLDKQQAAVNAHETKLPATAFPEPSVMMPSPSATGGTDAVDILVMGVDSRDFQIHGQTDCILLVRVDKDENLKIVCFSRDIYISIPDYAENRINEACVYGGPELVMKTINEAFGLDIKNYVVFDFKTAEKVINLMGSVTVSVVEDELDALNVRIHELDQLSDEAGKTPLVKKAGTQALNGRQTVAFAGIRPYDSSNFVRMDRQKEVLLGLMQLVKKMKYDTILAVANDAIGFIYTNIPVSQFPSVAMDLYRSRGGKPEFLTIPVAGTYSESTIVEMRFLVIDFRSNSNALIKFLN